jgi:DNA (cytosine-5)-methyltransferase 1
MASPRLLDLFCGAGGAAMGYHRAGFEVVGVDIAPQPHYPFTFHQADAMTWPLEGFDAIHASPPCQGYSRMRHLPWLAGREYPLLLDPVRERLIAAAVPWVIENVEDAPMPWSVVLCGTMFDLPIYRHRRFGMSMLILQPQCGPHAEVVFAGRMLKGRGRVSTWERGIRMPEVMGCPWMTQKEVSQAIPPAYTEFIGERLMGASRG